MNVNSLIIETLEPLGLPVEPTVYDGDSDKWITFNYADDRGVAFADDEPQFDLISVQIHLYVPRNFNYHNLKKEIRSRLFKVGFSYAQVAQFTEDEYQHIVFECEKEEEREE